MGKCKFDDKWQEEDKYRGWLKPLADQHEARCELCIKTFKLGTMGCGALDSHMKSEKHQPYLKIQKTNMAIDLFAAAKRFPNMPDSLRNRFRFYLSHTQYIAVKCSQSAPC